MNFGEYLYQLRMSHQPKKLTQGQVGDAIGATRQYIDALEKQKPGTTPPRWEQCLKIAQLLRLNESEKRKFLWLAFKERNRHNSEFYDFFHGEEEPLTPNREDKSKKRFSRGKLGKRREEHISFNCRYAISWSPTEEGFLKDAETRSLIQNSLKELSKTFQHTIHNIQISERQNLVSIEVSLTPLVIVDSVVRELKLALARDLRQHGKVLGHAQSVWSKDYEVMTLPAQKVIEPVTIEKVVTTV